MAQIMVSDRPSKQSPKCKIPSYTLYWHIRPDPENALQQKSTERVRKENAARSHAVDMPSWARDILKQSLMLQEHLMQIANSPHIAHVVATAAAQHHSAQAKGDDYLQQNKTHPQARAIISKVGIALARFPFPDSL